MEEIPTIKCPKCERDIPQDMWPPRKRYCRPCCEDETKAMIVGGINDIAQSICERNLIELVKLLEQPLWTGAKDASVKTDIQMELLGLLKRYRIIARTL